ncbi:glycine--tRNA ligase subunit beta [Escherichia coli]
MSEKTFLVEIGTEELPPKALRSLAESFAANFTAELDNAGLAHGTVQWFAAPRRLALKVANLAEAQPDREIENAARRLPRRSTLKANRAKRQKVGRVVGGITVDQAERSTTDKGEWLLYCAHVKGESTEALLPNMVATSLAKLPIPKLMRWGARRRALRASGAHRDLAAGRQSHSGNHSGHSVRSR